jgi:hypothetical protein
MRRTGKVICKCVKRSQLKWSQTETVGDRAAVEITEINFEIKNSKSGGCFPQTIYHADKM